MSNVYKNIKLRKAVIFMFGNKSCCGHSGKGMGDMSEWKEKYEKMSDSEKKEMLEKKQTHLKEKMAWVEEELGKLK
jgi:hypothetical protein